MSLADRVLEAVQAVRGVRGVTLSGSRAGGHEHAESDWDFLVEADDFACARDALPAATARLRPLAAQWDRLSETECFMLVVRGPVKVDLIFGAEPHRPEPPWRPSRDNLRSIDDHFWDWVLWLHGKAAGGRSELVAAELVKLSRHLLEPLGSRRAPRTIAGAVASYRVLRERAERRFGLQVPRALETEVAKVLR